MPILQVLKYMSDNRSLYTKVIALLSQAIIDFKKNFAIFLLAIIIPIATLSFLSLRKSNTYTASFTVVYEDLVRKIYGDRLEKLNTLLQSNNERAAELLNLDIKIVETIEEVKGTNILGEDLSKDMNIDRIPFIINITVTDTSKITEIQNGILSFLENSNSYLMEKRNLKISEIKDEIAFISTQLEMMDTLKRKYYLSGKDASLSTEKATGTQADVYGLSYDLFKKRQDLMKKLEMPMNLYIIDDALVSKSAGRSFKAIGIIGVLIGLILYTSIVYVLLPAIRYKQP